MYSGVGTTRPPVLHAVRRHRPRVSGMQHQMRGMGEFFAYSPPGTDGLGEYFAQNGLGEFFAYNGMGEMAPLTDDEKKKAAMYAGGGLIAGLLGATLLKKTKTTGLVVGAGLGVAAGVGAFYATRSQT